MIRAGAAGGLLSSLLLLSSGGSRGCAAMAAQRRVVHGDVCRPREGGDVSRANAAGRSFLMNSGAQDAAQTGHTRQATKTGRHAGIPRTEALGDEVPSGSFKSCFPLQSGQRSCNSESNLKHSPFRQRAAIITHPAFRGVSGDNSAATAKWRWTCSHVGAGAHRFQGGGRPSAHATPPPPSMW